MEQNTELEKNAQSEEVTEQPVQNRWKSWVLWTSIAALVVFCVKEFAGVDIGETVDGFMNVLLPVLVAFGIVNNPSDKERF